MKTTVCIIGVPPHSSESDIRKTFARFEGFVCMKLIEPSVLELFKEFISSKHQHHLCNNPRIILIRFQTHNQAEAIRIAVNKTIYLFGWIASIATMDLDSSILRSPPCDTICVGSIASKIRDKDLVSVFSKYPDYKRHLFRKKDNQRILFVQFSSTLSLKRFDEIRMDAERMQLSLKFSKKQWKPKKQ